MVSRMKQRSLRQFFNQRASEQDMVEIATDLQAMQDRPAAIVAGALVEDALQYTIEANIAKLSRKEHDALFLGFGPLATFSAKIRIARAFKLLDKEQTADLTAIRDIRNVFAHARITIKFDTPEIADQIDGIKILGRLGSPEVTAIAPGLGRLASELRLSTARERFLASAVMSAYMLWWVPANDLQSDLEADDT